MAASLSALIKFGRFHHGMLVSIFLLFVVQCILALMLNWLLLFLRQRQ
ncbi:hypothetical protein GPB2148_2929 [marine gamma proteobacterium HTCC2148]|nr:hypothetical protein GPB2148_2929 [marine gamma proteobacterium HTCC2148]